MTAPLTEAQAAAVAGFTDRHLRRLVAEGDGPNSEQGRYPAPDFGAWLRKRWHGTSLEEEKTRLTKAQADKTELEVAELRGELIRVSDATATWQDMFAAARAKLISLPNKVAPLVAAPSQIAHVEAAIRAEINEALHELAGDGLPAIVRARGARGDIHVDPATGLDDQRVGGRRAATEPRKQRRARKVADG